jgi:nucleotide-binding universal stress UspA family protein
MIRMRRILCPTDFSDCARRALEHAAALAGWYEARLTVLYVSSLTPSVVGFPPMVSPITLEPLSRERLLEQLRAFAGPALAAGVQCDFAIREGPAAREIAEEARACAADLVVIGTHGRGGFERLVLGSVTEKVLRKAPCPVLTVSPPAEGVVPRRPPELRHIVCPLDFSTPAKEALAHALSLAERAKARLTLLYVLEWPAKEPHHPPFDVPEYRRYLEEDARRELREAVPAAARDWCDVRERVAVGKPAREILQVAAAEGADLIVMGVHGHNVLDRLFFGSTAHHVVRAAACPVLTVRVRPAMEA